MISQSSDSAVIPSAFEKTQVGLKQNRKPTIADVTDVLRGVRDGREQNEWLAGDAMLYGTEAFGEKNLKEIATGLGLNYTSLRTLKWVSQSMPWEIRVTTLSHRHHREVAVCLTRESKQAWLQSAVEKNWSARELGKQIAATKPTEMKPKVTACKAALKQIQRMATELVTSWDQWSAEERVVLDAMLQKLGSIITKDSSGNFVVIKPTELPAMFNASTGDIAAAVQTPVTVATAVS